MEVEGAVQREAQVRTPDLFLERPASPSGPSSLTSSPAEPGSPPDMSPQSGASGQQQGSHTFPVAPPRGPSMARYPSAAPVCRPRAKFHLVLCFKSQAQSWQGSAILKVRKLRPKEVELLEAGGGCFGGRPACGSLNWGGRPGRGSQSRWGASAQVSLCGERGEAWLTGALVLPPGDP